MWANAVRRTPVMGGGVGASSLSIVRALITPLHQHVHTEGLFRVDADSEEVQLWLRKVEADVSGLDVQEPHLLATILKRYLRSMGGPLLTQELYDDFADAAREMDEAKLVDRVLRLPSNNFDILMELLGLCELMIEQQDKNHMNLESLASMLAPSIFTNTTPDMFSNSENQSHVRGVSSLIRCTPTIRKACQGGNEGADGVAARFVAQQVGAAQPGAARRSVRLTGSGKVEVKLGTTIAYSVYDYKGCTQAGTLTMRRGDALVILEAENDPSGNSKPRWYRCRHSESNEEGWCPVSFLDCPALERTPLGREKALMRAGTEASLPSSSPLRDPGGVGGFAQNAPQVDPLTLISGRPAHSLEEISDRMDLLSRALIREKEERLAIERRLQSALQLK